MSNALIINLQEYPGHWSLLRLSATATETLLSETLQPVIQEQNPEQEPSSNESQLTELVPQLIGIEKKLRTQNLNYESLQVLVNAKQKFSVHLELPFKDIKAIQQIITPELEDRLAIDPASFFIQFQPLRELASGLQEVYVNLFDPSEVAELFAVLSSAGLRPNLVTNLAGALTGILGQLNSHNNQGLLLLAHGADWHISAQTSAGYKIEEVISPSLESEEQNSDQNLLFRLKQLHLGHGDLQIWAADATTQARLEGLGLKTQIISPAEISPDCTEKNLITFGLLANLRSKNQIAPLANLCFGQYANNPLWTAAIDGAKKITPAVISACLALILGLGIYYFVQMTRINLIKDALSSKISLNLNRSDLTDVAMVSSENGILEEQLKTLGSPNSLNPADVFGQLSQDLHKETDIKFSRLKINANKATIEGLAPSYSAIDRIQRILKKRSSTYCDLTSRSSGAGSSPSFVIEVQLCQK
jgi:hypothetical protein